MASDRRDASGPEKLDLRSHDLPEEKKLTLELIRAMAERKPERVVCLDEGFAGNDQLKANAVQIFKAKGVASFRTV